MALLRYFFLSEVPIDSGDGLAHYFIAQRVWQNPVDLLNHWGKPLFTLFAAPFAYFGYTTYICFNVLIYCSTLYVAFLLSKKLKFQSALLLIYPLGLLTSLDYAGNILGGMTEVFFGFLVLLSCLLLIQKRWVWFAVLVSFLPFSRSEGQIMIPLALLVLVYFKAWKAIPFLFFGFLIYALVGLFAFDEFWWYFTQNPYRDASDIYGHGSWMHYINFWYVHLGVFGLLLLILGLPVFFYIATRRKNDSTKILAVFYLATIYFGILFTHMVLWAYGKNGALGLTRLAIHGWPGLLLGLLLVIDSVLEKNHLKFVFTGFSLVICIFLIVIFPFVPGKPFPKIASPDERAVLDATDFTAQLLKNNHINRVYYYHPLIAYAARVNLKDTSGVYIQKKFENFEKDLSNIKSSDLIILDTHFGFRDMNFPQEKMSLFDELAMFTPLDQYVNEGKEIASVRILRLANPELSIGLDTLVIFDSVFSSMDKVEFIPLLELPTKDFTHQNQKFQITASFKSIGEIPRIFLVVQSFESGESITLEIGEINEWKFSLSKQQAKTFKFFIHNPNGAEGTLTAKIRQLVSF